MNNLTATIANRDFTVVKNSAVHGKGVFAKKIIPKGTRIYEYAGKRVLKNNLVQDLANGLTSLMYVMNLSETTAIDGERDGNDARFINHSCSPNCEVYFFDDIPYIYAMQDIETGAEISFDYNLGLAKPEEITVVQKKELYPCNCGAANCRQTLISN